MIDDSMSVIYDEFRASMAVPVARLSVQAVASRMVGRQMTANAIEDAIAEITYAIKELETKLFYQQNSYVAIHNVYAIKYEKE